VPKGQFWLFSGCCQLGVRIVRWQPSVGFRPSPLLGNWSKPLSLGSVACPLARSPAFHSSLVWARMCQNPQAPRGRAVLDTALGTASPAFRHSLKGFRFGQHTHRIMPFENVSLIEGVSSEAFGRSAHHHAAVPPGNRSIRLTRSRIAEENRTREVPSCCEASSLTRSLPELRAISFAASASICSPKSKRCPRSELCSYSKSRISCSEDWGGESVDLANITSRARVTTARPALIKPMKSVICSERVSRLSRSRDSTSRNEPRGTRPRRTACKNRARAPLLRFSPVKPLRPRSWKLRDVSKDRPCCSAYFRESSV
jgi:hypothetical protein